MTIAIAVQYKLFILSMARRMHSDNASKAEQRCD